MDIQLHTQCEGIHYADYWKLLEITGDYLRLLKNSQKGFDWVFSRLCINNYVIDYGMCIMQCIMCVQCCNLCVTLDTLPIHSH